MKKNYKLPTILGIFILLTGLVAGIYLINSKQVFKLSANVEAIPKDVRLTNITNDRVTVTWTTDIESSGFVKWGNTEIALSKIALENGSQKSFVHSADILNTQDNTSIFLKINSNGKDYDNDGVVWQTKLSSQKIESGNKMIASGTILSSDGTNPAKAIVYLTINGVMLSGLSSDEGSYIIPISSFIKDVSEKTTIEISVNAGLNKTAQAIIYPKAIKSVPTIIIGKTYDFRSLEVKDESVSPESNLSIPESVEVSSKFEVQKTGQQASGDSVTIDSIDNGEIITTTDPEFFGKGPKNTTIDVVVESELQTGTLTTDSKGIWNWSPPNNLEPGEHKVTLKWKDASGILRTLTRTFIVQAAEGPAFESTPSATPLVEVTSSPSPTPRASKTPTATAPPTPETGDLLPTLGLFMIGVGILTSSIYIWNKSNVY